ncbi:MAG: amidohydrolase family protein [Myxococcota bacterium]
MRNGLPVLDADRHVIEPIEIWKEYLEARWRDGAPYLESVAITEPLPERLARLGNRGLVPLPPRMMIDGEPVWQKFSERAELDMAWTLFHRPGAMALGMDPDAQLRDMDATGIDAAWMFPSFAGYLVANDRLEAPRAEAFARAYNRWLEDFCARDPARLNGVGLIARHDPTTMVDQLEAVVHRGWQAVVLRPNPIQGRRLSDPSMEPFWDACGALGVAIAIHEGAHARVPTAGADRFDTHFGQIICSHPMEQMLAMLTLIEGGVLGRHRGLRIAFLEAGCGWLPYWLWRMDDMYHRFGWEVAANVPMKPSDLVRQQCFIGIEPGEPGLTTALEMAGDCLIFGSDFPHPDHDPDLLAGILDATPEDAQRRVLFDNTARLFGW